MRKIFFISMVIGTCLLNAPAYCEDLPEPIKEMVLKDIGFYGPVTIQIAIAKNDFWGDGVEVAGQGLSELWEEFLVRNGYLERVMNGYGSGKKLITPAHKLELYGRKARPDLYLSFKIQYATDITLAKRILKSIDYTNRWKIQPDNLDAWSFTFTYFLEPNLPELPRIGPCKGKGTAILNPATGQWQTRFPINPERGIIVAESQEYGSALGDSGVFAYTKWLEKQPKPESIPSTGVPSPKPSEATPSQPSSQLPPETTGKITIDSLTENLPYGKSNTGEFHAIEKIYNVSFDDAWVAVNNVLLNGGYEVVTSDRNKGILVVQGQGIIFNVTKWTAAIIERITEYSVKITIKNLMAGQYGGESFSNTIHKNLEKELKSKVKQPPYFAVIEGKQYKVSGDIFTVKKEGRVFKDEKGTVVRDPNLAKKIAEAAWVYENVVKAQGRPASERVSATLETHKALRRYELTQDVLARASVQILAAMLSDGATLTYTVPAGLTWRVVRDQFANLKGLLSLTGRQGLEEALSKYQQMESLIANLKPNHIDEAAAAEIKKLYDSAYGLDLPYSALLTSLMPKKGRELVDKALKDIGDELLRTLPLSDTAISDAVLTNRELFDLQGKMDDALTANPALKEYYEKLNLAKRLKAANEEVISAWAEYAVQYKE